MAMGNKVSVIHYLNQFFGGIGAEEEADVPPSHQEGPVGPRVALAQELGQGAEVLATLICGDNYFTEHQEEAVERLIEMAKGYDADVLVAGPAFGSGRYGMACGALSLAWQKSGKPALAAMNENNPGVELFKQDLYIARTGPTAADMGEALPTMAAMAMKLARYEEIGPASQESYFPRGIRRNLRLDKGAAERAADMLMAKFSGQQFQTELPVPSFGSVDPAPPVQDLTRSLVALVTESGLVPFGNPDRLETWNVSKWLKYPIVGRNGLGQGEFEAWHGGCDTAGTNADPDRAVPLDAARALESQGVIGRLHDHFYVTTGNMADIRTIVRLGSEIALDLKAAGVDAVILTST